MHDETHSTTYLHPSGMGTVGSATPSGLTPNTRSEAEAALALNTIRQTDSAAPTTPLPVPTDENTYPGMNDGLDEAKRSYRRSPAIASPSSANYAASLAAARAETSASSDLSTHSVDQQSTPTQSPFSSTTPFPAPGQGIVPLHTGIGSGQAEVVRKAKPTGLSLGDLGRRQSWSQQDLKHIANAELMGKVDGDAGYGSGEERKEEGR